MKKTANSSNVTSIIIRSVLFSLFCCLVFFSKAQDACCHPYFSYSSPCTGSPMSFQSTSDCTTPATYTWDFGDGTTASGPTVTHLFSTPGNYYVSLNATASGSGDSECSSTNTFLVTVGVCPETGCVNCIGSFAPTPGDYMVSVWVKETNHTVPVTNYDNTGIKISFIGSSTVYGPFYPDSKTDPIIDGWQRIERKITIPATATDITVDLENDNSGTIDSYFDDIRIHPFDGSMKSYVYDPVTLRLVAELDENNYATLYEYDEEGKLIRVKKETEKGIMTIKETRSANKKRTP